MKNSNERDQKPGKRGQKNEPTQSASKQMDDLQKEADGSTKSKKAGSQSNSSKQHNNGRGGGK